MFDELVIYWDAILSEISLLREPPEKMRFHDADQEDNHEYSDSLLFWPIGQELFANVVRARLNRFLPDSDKPNLDEVKECVKIFAEVNWSLHEPPWRGLFLTYDSSSKKWRMRNEDRKKVVEIGTRILRYQVGLDDLLEKDLDALQLDWHAMLMPSRDDTEADEQWQQIAVVLSS